MVTPNLRVLAVTLLLPTVLCTVSNIVAPRELNAQTTRADTAMVLLRVAQDLRAAGRESDAEALIRIILEQYAGTAAASEARSVQVELASSPGSGTVALAAWHTVYGAVLGTLIPAALGVDEPEPYGLGLLLGGPVGFFGARSFARSRGLTSGQAAAINFGSYWGTIQGILVRDLLNIGDEETCFTPAPGLPPQCFSDTPDEAPSAAAVLGGLSGLLFSGALATSRPINATTGLSLFFASSWGTFYGAMMAIMADADETGDEIPYLFFGGNAGFLLAALAAPKLTWDASRTWLVNLSGWAGLIAGLGLDLIFNSDDQALNALVPAVTGTAGLAIGVGITSERPAPPRRPGMPESGVNIGSLLNLNGEQLSLGIPIPIPARIESRNGRYSNGVTVSLVKGRF